MPEMVLTRYLQTLAETLEGDYGVRRAAFFRAAKLPANVLGERRERVLAAEADALWTAATDQAGDGLLGVRFGARVRYSSYATLGHLLVTCDTVGDGLQVAVDHVGYVGMGGALELSEAAAECSLIYRPFQEPWAAAQERSEAVLLPFARFARWTASGVVPQRVCLKRKRPADPKPFLDAFGTKIEFGRATNKIVWSQASLSQPMTDANASLNEMLRRQVRRELETDEAVAAKVRRFLAEALDGEDAATAGTCSIEACAAALGVSVRTLQRQLGQEQSPFRDLLKSARFHRAKMLLQTTLPVAQVSHILGYSEPAAFVRAFRIWSGHTPTQYRAHAVSNRRQRPRHLKEHHR